MKIPIAEIKRILDYLYEDEKRDYKETCQEGHIFNDIQKVKNWIKKTAPSNKTR